MRNGQAIRTVLVLILELAGCLDFAEPDTPDELGPKVVARNVAAVGSGV